ncbi:hypothetical protein AK830_g909 [Neonectria ditissima]|uniref:Uncharacterized protein n=1 Tax=Neonectria ditissima TaxID=78410 RepID=A0A0P7BXL7_9HYPO|nr:hypothetical protein AK830_g909 [Neonectria ditissima]
MEPRANGSKSDQTAPTGYVSVQRNWAAGLSSLPKDASAGPSRRGGLGGLLRWLDEQPRDAPFNTVASVSAIQGSSTDTYPQRPPIESKSVEATDGTQRKRRNPAFIFD